MKRKEERFKCVALTTVGGWISMIVAFLVGLYLASRGKRTSACDGNLLFLCKELRDETKNVKILKSFVERRQPIVLRGTAESLVQNLDIEDYVPFDEIPDDYVMPLSGLTKAELYKKYYYKNYY